VILSQNPIFVMDSRLKNRLLRLDKLPPAFIVVVKKRPGVQLFFATTTDAAIPFFGTLLWKAV